MINSSFSNNYVFFGTIGGMLSALCNLAAHPDFAATVMLSATGAVVSVTVSFLLNLLIRKIRRK